MSGLLTSLKPALGAAVGTPSAIAAPDGTASKISPDLNTLATSCMLAELLKDSRVVKSRLKLSNGILNLPSPRSRPSGGMGLLPHGLRTVTHRLPSPSVSVPNTEY